jgi:ABC-type Zn uptake system ZnuABC Zn-binding protein ZnuA
VRIHSPGIAAATALCSLSFGLTACGSSSPASTDAATQTSDQSATADSIANGDAGKASAAPTSSSGCATGTPGSGRAIVIATTVAPITSIIANIAAGTNAQVTGLVPEGTNSHTFEPPPSSAKAVSDADIVFINGLKLEDPTRDLATANAKAGSQICELGTAILPESQWIYDFSFPKEGGKPNPHLWTNPPMARDYAKVAKDVLVRRDPSNAATYEENFTAFAAKVDALDAAMKSATTGMPEQSRQLLTYHDAYAYFAAHYGWTVVGAIQPSSFNEPTAKEVAKLIEQIKEQKVPAVFGSEVFPSPVLEQIGKESGARYVDVLRDDDLPGAPGDPTHSFLGLMRFDYVTMVEALGGDATELKALDMTDVGPDKADYPQ